MELFSKSPYEMVFNYFKGAGLSAQEAAKKAAEIGDSRLGALTTITGSLLSRGVAQVGIGLGKIGTPIIQGAIKLVSPGIDIAGVAISPVASAVTGGAVVLGAGFLAYKGVKFALNHFSKKKKQEYAYSA